MTALEKRKIVLIGGAGFIGHHLALELAKKGAHVEIIDSLQINNLLTFASGGKNLPNRDLYYHFVNDRLNRLHEIGIPVHVQDAREYHGLSYILARIKPQVIIHLAAVAHAGNSNKDPYNTFDHSLRTLENALDYSRDSIEHFIYFSSSMVYGHFNSESVTEETYCEPLGIYGALKFAGEKMVIAYNQVFKLPYTILRPSALYGERCVSRRVGQIFIENAMQGLDISISGNGSDRLDFTYVSDLVDGTCKILENENSKNQIFNLTYGVSRSIAEMAQILIENFPTAKIKYLPKDDLIPDRGTLCMDKARKLLNYNPQYPLERGFVRYIEWYKSIWPIYEGEHRQKGLQSKFAVTQ